MDTQKNFLEEIQKIQCHLDNMIHISNLFIECCSQGSSLSKFDAKTLEQNGNAVNDVTNSVVTDLSAVSASNPIVLQSSVVPPSVIDRLTLSDANSVVLDDGFVSSNHVPMLSVSNSDDYIDDVGTVTRLVVISESQDLQHNCVDGDLCTDIMCIDQGQFDVGLKAGHATILDKGGTVPDAQCDNIVRGVTSARCDGKNAVLNLLLGAVDASGHDLSLHDDDADVVTESARVCANRIVHSEYNAVDFDCLSGPAPTAGMVSYYASVCNRHNSVVASTDVSIGKATYVSEVFAHTPIPVNLSSAVSTCTFNTTAVVISSHEGQEAKMFLHDNMKDLTDIVSLVVCNWCLCSLAHVMSFLMVNCFLLVTIDQQQFLHSELLAYGGSFMARYWYIAWTATSRSTELVRIILLHGHVYPENSLDPLVMQTLEITQVAMISDFCFAPRVISFVVLLCVVISQYFGTMSMGLRYRHIVKFSVTNAKSITTATGWPPPDYSLESMDASPPVQRVWLPYGNFLMVSGSLRVTVIVMIKAQSCLGRVLYKGANVFSVEPAVSEALLIGQIFGWHQEVQDFLVTKSNCAPTVRCSNATKWNFDALDNVFVPLSFQVFTISVNAFLVTLTSNLCSEFLLCRAAMPKDSTAGTAQLLGASSVLNRSIVIPSSASPLHALADTMFIFAQVKSLIDQQPMLVSACKHHVAHPQASAWCAEFCPWVKVATVIPEMASLGTGCSVLTILIAMVLSILCFDPGIGCSNCYGWHRSKMLVFSPLTDAWVLSSGPTLILVLRRVPHWCATGKHGLLTLFWCLDFETMDVSAMQWSAPFSICIVRVYYVLSFKCSLMVLCCVFCSSAGYVIRAGRLGSLLWLLLPDDYHDCRAIVQLTLHESLLLLWLSFSVFITWITSVAISPSWNHSSCGTLGVTLGTIRNSISNIDSFRGMVPLQRYHSGTYYTYWICPSIWHGRIASVLSSAKPSILCTCNFLVLHNELIMCAVGFLLSNCISCSLSHHREFSILQVGLLRSIQGQQFNCFTGCHSDLCSSPKLFPLTVLRVRALFLPKNETQGFIPAAHLLVHIMFSFGSACTLETTLCQVNGSDGGLFILAKTLFDIDIEPADGLAPVWNKDVRFSRVKYSSGNPIAYFYFDPYSLPAEKRGGAWLDEVVARSRALVRKGTSARLLVGTSPTL